MFWKIKERKRIKLKTGNRRLHDDDSDDDNNNNNNNEGVVVDFDISKTHNRKKVNFPISKCSNALFDSYLLEDRTMLVKYR
jgi:hypothetical protein